MPGNCCNEIKFDGIDPLYKKALLVVILINAVMFVVEMLSGVRAESQALKADALDFLGDAATYALSLWAIGRAATTRANAALVKGVSLLFMAAWVFGSTLYHFYYSNQPTAITMSAIGLLAFFANSASVLILLRYRNGDANVRSVWLCSRNDAIGNLMVIIAGAAVWQSGTAWPDLIAACILAGLFVNSSVQIIRQALQEKKLATDQESDLCA
jgi:Co/Zn/Cd efflux system component